MVRRMDKGTIIRTVLLLIALINQVLIILDLNPLPFSNADIYEGLTAFLTVMASLWAWFKNNYVTKTGERQKKVLSKAGLLKKG